MTKSIARECEQKRNKIHGNRSDPPRQRREPIAAGRRAAGTALGQNRPALTAERSSKQVHLRADRIFRIQILKVGALAVKFRIDALDEPLQRQRPVDEI